MQMYALGRRYRRLEIVQTLPTLHPNLILGKILIIKTKVIPVQQLRNKNKISTKKT
jgi:hypothetical protein